MLYRRADLFIFKSFLHHKQNVIAIALKKGRCWNSKVSLKGTKYWVAITKKNIAIEPKEVASPEK
jgi:hypothetical protein